MCCICLFKFVIITLHYINLDSGPSNVVVVTYFISIELTELGTARCLYRLYVLAVESLPRRLRGHADLVVGPSATRPFSRSPTLVGRTMLTAGTYKPHQQPASITQSGLG